MSKFYFRLSFLFLIIHLYTSSGFSQDRNGNTITNLLINEGVYDEVRPENPNNIKLNLFSLALQSVSMQYERTINKPFSFALGVQFMPSRSLPLKDIVNDLYPDADDAIIKAIDQLRLNQFSVTPELRWYVGRKGYGRGFYLAPFFRYSRFSINEIGFDYESTLLTKEQVLLKGELTAKTLGLMLGAQWNLGSRFSLDWWIIGPQFGNATGILEGRTTRALSIEDESSVQEILQSAFGELSSTNGIFSVSNNINVNSQGATVTLKGPWGGIRAGLCLGFRF